ncbi:MAG TPA: hypothetical protein VGN42_08160 [Pirellulales bacterium]|nr:hypothetical protein [Pirellulales bacterium]
MYSLDRWCYLGSIDSWIPLDSGKPLELLANHSLPHLGRESFFELS